MFCGNCGAENKDGAHFCVSCGTKLDVQEIPPVQQPIQQPIQQQPVQQQTPVQQQSPKVKKPFVLKDWKLVIVASAEAIVLIIAIAAFFAVGKNSFGYKKVAEKFFTSYTDGNYAAALKCLAIEDSEFMTADMWSRAIGEPEHMVTNYGIDTAREKNYSAEVNFKYRMTGSSSTQHNYIMLTKERSKKFLIFDNWKIDATEYVAVDYGVYVPEGAAAVVDGIELSKDYIEDSDRNGYDYYVVPELFIGNHKISCTAEGFQSASENVYIGYDNDCYQFDSLTLDTKTQETLMQRAYGDMQKIMNAAASGADFLTISDVFSQDADVQEYAQSNYEKLVDSFSDGTEEGVTAIRFSDVSAEYEGAYNSDGITAEICVMYQAEADSLIADYFEDSLQKKTYSTDSSYYVDYCLEDGKWCVTTTYMPDFSYYW